MMRKVLVDYISDMGCINIEHFEHKHSRAFHKSPCFGARRAIGMTDYTKAFLAQADRNANRQNDDTEGAGLDIVPHYVSAA